MSRSNSTAHKSDSEAEKHSLVVLKGLQAGARADILRESTVTVGTGLENDVVLYSHGENQCQLMITGKPESIELVVVKGTVLKNGEPLDIGVAHKVSVREQFSMADSVFKFELASAQYSSQCDFSDYPPDRAGEATSNRALTYLYIAGGLILLTTVVTTGLVRAFQNDGEQRKSFSQELSAAGYKSLHVIPSHGNLPAKVSGAVYSLEDRSNILAIAGDTQTEIELDLQINEDLAGNVEDIYRVNGIAADVRVTGIGEVEVWTSTRDNELLNSMESIIKKDIPDVLSLTTTNSIPDELVVEINPVASNDPDKQVTLVVAGADGYLMTRDKSRYFVGSILPSGHVIHKIDDGNVYVYSETGEILVLDFN